MYEIIFLDEVGEESRDIATSKETFDWKMSALKIAGATIVRYGKVSDTDRISPDDIGNDIEETIEIVPDMKWFVRSKEKYEADPVQGIPESGYLYLTDGCDDYGISYCEMTTFKDDATQFDTREEAELWANPDTEAVKLPVEDK